jgi:tartronate-semialdehyde synthase
MRATEAAVHVLEREGVTVTFGVPGAAINPIYAAMRPRNTIQHFLARHVEGASHMAEGCTRARAGNIGVNRYPSTNRALRLRRLKRRSRC